MLRTMDGRMEWVEGRARRLPGLPPELAAVAVALVVLLALVL